MHRKAKYYVETPRKCRKDQKNTLKENSIWKNKPIEKKILKCMPCVV